MNKKISANGIYAIQFFALNIPITIIIDDWLPLRRWGNSFTTWFAKVGDDGSLWGPLIEKAFSKFHGNYWRTVGGDPVDGISTLNGSPYDRLWMDETPLDEVWITLSTYDIDNRRGLMVAGTPNSPDFNTKNEYGLLYDHAYTILSVHTLSNG